MSEKRIRIVFIPPLPLNAFPYKQFSLLVSKTSFEGLKKILKKYQESGVELEIKNFVRHESTVQILNQELGLSLKPSSELYSYQEGDIMIVVGLKKPVRGQEIQVSRDDIELAIVTLKRLK